MLVTHTRSPSEKSLGWERPRYGSIERTTRICQLMLNSRIVLVVESADLFS